MSEETVNNTKVNIAKTNLYLFTIFFVSHESIVYLANDMIMPGMVDVIIQFNVGLEYVASSLSVYILGNTFLQLFLGPTSDRFGKRKIMLIRNCLFFIFTQFL